MILSGFAVHLTGFGLALCSTTKRLMAACKSTTDKKTPRFNRRLVSLAKKPSTALSQDAEVGVKRNVQRGCRASHFCTLGCLSASEPPQAKCMPRRPTCTECPLQTKTPASSGLTGAKLCMQLPIGGADIQAEYSAGVNLKRPKPPTKSKLKLSTCRRQHWL
jgi:hypothetical protein